ncbi:MFS transporter [Dechloromonas sp. ZY10]|uniref:MFS transporter n=1 Tax=Dechloromonas aquae TaxID=2664436 RepID=UPI0035290A99
MERRETLAYGLLGLPLAFAALPLYVHLPPLYASLGVDLAWLGAILLLSRLLDAAVDPWLGRLADRWSRPRLLALALPLLALGFAGLTRPPAGAGGGWLLLWLLPTYLGFSAATLAYQAWGAALGVTPGQRTRLTAAREGWGLLGILLAAVLPAWWQGQGAAIAESLQPLGWMLPPLLLLAAWPLYRLGQRRHGSWQHPVLPPVSGNWASLRADPAIWRLLSVFAVNGLASALPATLFLFFVADVLQRPASGGALLGLYFLAGALSLPLWVRLAAMHGRVAAWAAGMLLALLAFAGAVWLGPGDLVPFALICLASGLALGADLALPAALLADLSERLGQSGRCFGVWNLVAKLNLALAAGLALPLLAVAGYVPGQPQGTAALVLAYAVLPLLCKLLALALLWRWRPILEEVR